MSLPRALVSGQAGSAQIGHLRLRPHSGRLRARGGLPAR